MSARTFLLTPDSRGFSPLECVVLCLLFGFGTFAMGAAYEWWAVGGFS